MRATKRMVTIAGFVLVASGCGGSGAKPADAGPSGSGTGGSGSGSSSGTGGGSAKSGTGTGGSKSSGTGGSSASSGTGGSSSSGTGGSSSSGTGGSSSSGTGGSTGSVTLPTDGNQLSVCTMAQGDCNKGFACYGGSTPFSAGRGFCSKICTMDTDCDGLAPSGTKYTCTTGGGGVHMCDVVCTGTDDTTSCPAHMTCQQTAAATGGTMASFRCKYPLEKSGAWGPCNDGTHECDAMLTCAGTTSSMSRTGYCTASCMMDGDCPKPSSGTVTPTCITVAPARGMMMATKLCGLDCSMAMSGCPTGEVCTMIGMPTMGMGGMGGTGGGTRRCEYP
jgi:hypothetical protein